MNFCNKENFLKFSFFAYLILVFIGTKPYWQDGQFVSDGDIDPLRQVLVLSFFFITCLLLIQIKILNLVKNFLFQNLAVSLIAVLIATSAIWSDQPGFTIRRSFVYIALFMFSLTVFLILESRVIFNILKLSLLAVLLINTVSFIALGPISYDHEGLFKGVHVHKNTAGAVFSITCLIFFFDRNINFFWRFFIVSISLFFLIISGSKTSFGLVIAVISICQFIKYFAFFSKFWLRMLMAVFTLFCIILTLFAGLESIFYYVGDLYGDRTFTGRETIWNFSAYFIAERPLIGWGYGAFWGVGNSSNNIFFSDGFIENYGQSHNGYLDVLLQLGYLGFTLVAILLVFAVKSVFRKLISNPSNSNLLIYFSIFLFVICHNLLESTLLLPLSILWPVFLIFYFSIASKENE